jgi:hypothetical protein
MRKHRKTPVGSRKTHMCSSMRSSLQNALTQCEDLKPFHIATNNFPRLNPIDREFILKTYVPVSQQLFSLKKKIQEASSKSHVNLETVSLRVGFSRRSTFPKSSSMRFHTSEKPFFAPCTVFQLGQLRKAQEAVQSRLGLFSRR